MPQLKSPDLTVRIGTNYAGSPKRRHRRLLQLNDKHRELIRAVASGLNVSEAGRAAGYGTAQSAHRAMNLIRTRMPEMLEKCNFPAEKLLKNLIESLEATKILHFSYRGVVLDSRTVPDHKIRLRSAIFRAWSSIPRSASRASYNLPERDSASRINRSNPMSPLG
jgi:hypothetical protein